MMRVLWISLLGVSFFVAGGVPLQAACQNYVGGVCLDKKKAPAKKPVTTSKPKKVIKKKTTPNKAKPQQVTIQPAKPSKSSANACVQLSAGKASNFDFDKEVVYSNITTRNTCSETITVYLQLNACRSPRAYFNPMVGNSRKKFKLRKGASVSHRVAHEETLRGANNLARTSAAYSGEKTNYPSFGC